MENLISLKDHSGRPQVTLFLWRSFYDESCYDGFSWFPSVYSYIDQVRSSLFLLFFFGLSSEITLFLHVFILIPLFLLLFFSSIYASPKLGFPMLNTVFLYMTDQCLRIFCSKPYSLFYVFHRQYSLFICLFIIASPSWCLFSFVIYSTVWPLVPYLLSLKEIIFICILWMFLDDICCFIIFFISYPRVSPLSVLPSPSCPKPALFN